MPSLFYIHDPMCSWCWAFRPIKQRLWSAIKTQSFPVVEILGGLAPDTEEPMPQDLQTQLQHTWQRIQQTVPGTVFNYEFWTQNTPRRSTYRACRAVIIAQQQTQDADATDAMTHAIQRAYYLEAKNPSDTETLIECARQVGLSIEHFEKKLDSDVTRELHQQQMTLANALEVGGYPSLVWVDGRRRLTPIHIDYNNHAAIEKQIAALAAAEI
ncbi:MAG: DsbA family protein [Gammaproteobacteria bacterium]|nr:DsbA family protein [Gammaproteobacteria bacterium]